MLDNRMLLTSGCEFYAGTSHVPNESTWSGHCRNCNLILCTSGEGKVTIDGRSHAFQGRVLVWLAPGKPREFLIYRNWEAYYVHYDGEELGELSPQWEMSDPDCRILPLNDQDFLLQQNIFNQICQLVKERRRGWRQLGYTLIRECLLRGNMATEAVLLPEHLQLALRMLGKIDTPVSIEEIAAACHMSHASFYSKFKQTFGVTPRCYRENEVMRQVRHLLETTDMTLSEIAWKFGLESAFYLSHRFKKITGQSPSRYRRSFLSPPANALRTSS